tara:strand:- start:66 stop:350 length:285 start_codon:yes stop_codon:yes gene_type:complete
MGKELEDKLREQLRKQGEITTMLGEKLSEINDIVYKYEKNRNSDNASQNSKSGDVPFGGLVKALSTPFGDNTIINNDLRKANRTIQAIKNVIKS